MRSKASRDAVRTIALRWLQAHAADPQTSTESLAALIENEEFLAMSPERQQIVWAGLPFELAERRMLTLQAAVGTLAARILEAREAIAGMEAELSYWVTEAAAQLLFAEGASREPRMRLRREREGACRRARDCGTFGTVCYVTNHRALGAGLPLVREHAPPRSDDLADLLSARDRELARAQERKDAEARRGAAASVADRVRFAERDRLAKARGVRLEPRAEGVTLAVDGLDESRLKRLLAAVLEAS